VVRIGALGPSGAGISGETEPTEAAVRAPSRPGGRSGSRAPEHPGEVPVEVPGTLPGERVRVALEHAGRRRRSARLVEVLQPSPDRVDPACPHFSRCGGCQLLHAVPALQRRAKRAWVAEALEWPESRVDPVVPSPRAFAYRAFAKLVVGPDGILGSYRPRSHDVQSMEGCRIHTTSIERVADDLRAHFGADGGAPAGLRYVLLRASIAESAVLVTLVTDRDDVPGLARIVERWRDRRDVGAVLQHVNPSEGDALWGRGPTRSLLHRGPLWERVGPIRYDLLAGAFSQVNPEGAALLYDHVARALFGACVGDGSGAAPSDASRGSPARTTDGAGRAPGVRSTPVRAADLYAGSGGIAQTLLHAGLTEVVAVEAAPAAAAALHEASRRWAGRLAVRCGPVEDHLEVLDTVDAAVANPPRKGLADAVVGALRDRGPRRVVYVSCNLATLARDLRALAPAYRLERVTPFDVFPQTRHVETVVQLARRRDADGAA